MTLKKLYQLKCDGCGHVPPTANSSPRKLRSLARKVGWVRLQVKVGEYERREWVEDSQGRWHQTDDFVIEPVYAGRDYYAACEEHVKDVKP